MRECGAGSRLKAAVAASGFVVLLCGSPVTAMAQSPVPGATCAQAEVSARGEPASYRWLAVLKARGNWRGKVRALPGLGARYADFAIASNPVERCIFNTGSVVCTVTATPCGR